MGFRQYLYRGKDNVQAESVLVAIAYNINKLHWKIQSQKGKTMVLAQNGGIALTD
jgi:hypothetical protein